MTPQEHVAAAESLVADAKDDGLGTATARDMLTAAHVHATLALVAATLRVRFTSANRTDCICTDADMSVIPYRSADCPRHGAEQ